MVLRAEGNGEPGRGAGGREGGRWLRVCPVSLPPALLRAPGSGRTGDGASRALRRGALPGARCGGGMYRDCCRGPSEPRARDRRTNPAGGPCGPWAGSSGPPAAAGAVGTPSFLCWWGGAGINHAGIPQCGGSLCDFYARLKPGEVSVPASVPRHCSACGQAHWGSTGQLLCRASEGLMPPSFPRKAPASGVSLPLAAADMAGLLVTSAQPPPGRDLPGLWNSPAAVPAALQRLVLHHAYPGATGTPAGTPTHSQVGRKRQS